MKNVKKIGCIFILIIWLLIICCGIFYYLTSYKITVSGDRMLIASCPKRAKAGQTVTVSTAAVCDGDLKISISGAEYERTDVTTIQFVMPERDVEISARVVTSANGGS